MTKNPAQICVSFHVTYHIPHTTYYILHSPVVSGDGIKTAVPVSVVME